MSLTLFVVVLSIGIYFSDVSDDTSTQFLFVCMLTRSVYSVRISRLIVSEFVVFLVSS